MFGRDSATTERVVLDDAGIRFQQISGYLPAVEERIAILAAGEDTVLTYGGRYQSRPSFWGRLLGPLLVPRTYWRAARKTLEKAKQLAEAPHTQSLMCRRAPCRGWASLA